MVEPGRIHGSQSGGCSSGEQFLAPGFGAEGKSRQSAQEEARLLSSGLDSCSSQRDSLRCLHEGGRATKKKIALIALLISQFSLINLFTGIRFFAGSKRPLFHPSQALEGSERRACVGREVADVSCLHP